MRVLILGGGGREHALAWKIAASPLLQKLYISPGNPGTAELGENIAGDILDPKAVLKLVQTLGIDLMVIGPEACLAAGVTDAVRAGERRGAGSWGHTGRGRASNGARPTLRIL
ncbi:MAG: Phosphoribosylamine--glycine ligase [Firmicutes bacterium]|nr:Phosphoribosylamine--glycine ligase [Bacillota bacterium]